MILINQTGMFSFSQKFVKKKIIKNLNYGIILNIKNYIYIGVVIALYASC